MDTQDSRSLPARQLRLPPSAPRYIRTRSTEGTSETELPREEYETINGLVIALLGEIPDENEHPEVTFERYKFTVAESNEKFITKIKLEILPPVENQEEEENEDL